MDSYLHLSADDQRIYCEQASATLGLLPSSVEKDFWVCWILRELFSLPEIGGGLTFKGGTSLSKGWALIQRFSEDIDIVMDRTLVGVATEPPAGSRKNLDRYLESLTSGTKVFIRQRLLPELREHLHDRLPPAIRWTLRHSDEDPNNEAILFEYESRFDRGGYVAPVVKIEPGARSDTAPSDIKDIEPFLSPYLEDARFQVRCVHPKRTFWEKAMLLHEELSRQSGAPPKPRLARHYYDLSRLIEAGIGEQALADSNLFDAVAQHRRIFFRRSQAIHDAARPGTFRLSPHADQLQDWQRDYDTMREAMFYGEDPPGFGEILRIVAEFESRLNSLYSS